MKRTHVFELTLCAVLFTPAAPTMAQTLPIPGGEAARNVPGAHELPDPNLTYKVVFDLAAAAPNVDTINPGLATVARFVNTLAKYGVPADHRKIVAVFHRAATEAIVNNATYAARNQGHGNPNIALIQQMKEAGVDFRVCGQAVLAHKIDPKTIVPEIQLDLWAMTTIVNFELRGYAHLTAD